MSTRRDPRSDSSGADPADPTGFDRLTRRHRECLRGVLALKGSKEIAEELGIEKSTVDSYLTEAVRLIGARNRRDAALRWGAHEARIDAQAVDASPSEKTINPVEAAPDKIGDHSARLVPAAVVPPSPVSPDEPFVGAPEPAGSAPSRPAPSRFRLPFRRKGQRGNDLSVGDRLIWIQAITLGIAIGFGMLMTGLQALTHLIEAVTRTLS